MKFYDEKSFDGNPGSEVKTPPSVKAGMLERWLITKLRALLDRDQGTLELLLPNGHRYLFGQNQPFASIQLNNYRCLLKMISGGTNGLSESYLAGDWDSPDLSSLIRWGIRYEPYLEGTAKLRFLSDIRHNRFHQSRDNNREGSRRNIAAHYDLGNDFYRRWLDPSMTYSAALFTERGQTLEQAQEAKYQRILELSGATAGMHVAEIGCGWGGFAEHAGRQQIGVHGITLSEQQLAWGQERISNAGLDTHVQLSLTDYRDLNAQFDAVVSIEMFEAVGEAHWDTYFQQLQALLKQEGKAVLQIITIDDDRFESYRKQADFIQRYIFPGGMLPSVKVLKEKFQQHGFKLEYQQMFGQDYARTLKLWDETFVENYQQIQPLGFDQHFYRLWRYYLAYCEGGFRENAIDVGLFVLSRE